MKGLIGIVKKYWMLIIPSCLLVLFIYSIWDRNFYIGGDLIFPLKPQDNMIKSLFLWEEQNGGISFFKYMLFFWQGFFYLLSLLHIPTDVSIKLFIITIYVLAFIFSYLLYLVLFKDTKFESKPYALLFANIFLFNPAALLLLVGTLPLYGIPICFYFLVKYLDTRNILYTIGFAFFLNITYFPDLPQAKLLIIFCLATLFLLSIYKTIREVSTRSLIFPLCVIAGLTFLLNAFLLVPFINDSLGEKGAYHTYSEAVNAYNGDADYLSAALPYISRFYNSNLVGKGSLVGQFLSNPLFTIWTFFLLGIATVVTFFLREKRDKSILYISLCAFVLFIFIAKGANPPFGELYRWMLSHIFIVKLFRTTATAVMGGVIFYALLVTLTVYYLSKKWKKVFILIFIVNILMFYPIYLGYKLDNWIGGSVHQKGVSIPDEYYEMGKLLDDIKDDGKILILPLNDGYLVKNWGYSGQSPITWLTKKPLISNNTMLDNNLDTKSTEELCTFAAQYNIGYLLTEKDTTSSTIKRHIDFSGKTILENQYFHLQKTDDKCALPHFYIAEKSIYFKGDIRQIPSLAYLPDYNKYSFLHQEDNMLSSVNVIVSEQSPSNTKIDFTKNYLNLDLGQDKLIQDIFYPSVSINPGSPFYPLIVWKEEQKLNNDKLDKRQLLDLQIVSALKRISEVDRWGVGNTWWQNSQKQFKKTIQKGIHTAVISDHPRDNLELLFEYVRKCKEKIEEIAKNQPFWDKGKINSWDTMFVGLQEDIQKQLYIPDFTNLSFNLTVPVYGNYHGFMIGNAGTSFIEKDEKLNMKINNIFSSTAIIADPSYNNVIDLGQIPIDATTKNLDLQFSNQPNHIDISKWIMGEQINTVKTDSAGIVFAPNQQNGYYISFNQIIYQEVSNWEKGETYLLRITHKDSEGAALRLVVREKKETYDRNSDSWISKEANIVDEYLNNMQDDGESKILLKADKNVTNAWIYLYVTGGTITVKNIELQKIIIPHLFLVNDTSNSLPVVTQHTQVHFTKINPTKYIVTIDKLTKPITLVFSESFDRGWKVVSKNGKTLPETTHILANGYANAWTLDPQNSEIKNSPQLFVEYRPQRTFYFGQGVSIISLAGCIIFFIYTFFKKKRYNKK